MNFFHIICLICFGASITCAPVDQITFYDAIVQKCPSVKSLPKFKDQILFRSCNNWQKISEVGNLTDDNKKEVLCWLYFNSFTQYCNHTQQMQASLPPSVVKLDLNAVCDKLEVIPKQLERTNSLHNIIKTTDDCTRLCSDEIGWVESLCSISYYYSLQSNVSIKSPNHLIRVPAQDQTVQESHKDEKQQELAEPEKAPLNTKLAANQKIQQTTEEHSDQNTERVVENVDNEPALSKVKADQNNISKNAAVPTPPQPQPVVKYGETATNHVDELPAIKNTNVDNGNSGVSLNKDKKQDPNKGNEVANSAPAPPPLVDQNVEVVPVDKIPVDKTPDNVDLNDLDMGPNEDVMRPESEEDLIQEQSDIMPHDKPKPGETEAVNFATEMDGDSYFFTYFMLLCVIFIVGYVCYHNKQKILALILEGRRGKRQYRGRRPNSANYHKLDSNLEEAITSSCNKNTNNVIY